MDSVGHIALTVLGIVGLSGLLAGASFSRRLGRHHRFFRFQYGEQLDFVLTTSSREVGGYGGVRYTRPTTAVGNLKGATEIAQAVGYGSRRRPITVGVSADLEASLDGDLILLGLPGKNRTSGLVLAELAAHYPEIGLAITEQEADGGSCMALGDYSEHYTVRTQPDSEIPEHDLALIVLWINPLALRKRRLILCAGFTAHGTARAASYVVHDVLNHRLSSLRREHSALPRLWGRKWICFAMIIEVWLVNDQAVRVRERAFTPLEDPGCPPFARAVRPLRSSASDQGYGSLQLDEPIDELPAPGDNSVELGQR